MNRDDLIYYLSQTDLDNTQGDILEDLKKVLWGKRCDKHDELKIIPGYKKMINGIRKDYQIKRMRVCHSCEQEMNKCV